MMEKNTQNILDRAISILGDLVGFSVLGGQSNLSIAGYITGLLQRNKIFKIQTSKQFSIVPSLNTSEHSEVVRMVNSFNGNESTKTVSFALEVGFETVVCGPGSMDQGHIADEFIEISELKKCLSFLERLSGWAETSKEANMDYEKI